MIFFSSRVITVGKMHKEFTYDNVISMYAMFEYEREVSAEH